MEAEAVRCWRTASRHYDSALPSMAAFLATGRVVLEYGHAWSYRIVLRHGDCSAHYLHHHRLHDTTWLLALS